MIGKFHVTKFYSLEMAREIMNKLRSDEYGGRGKLGELYAYLCSGKMARKYPYHFLPQLFMREKRSLPPWAYLPI